MRFAIIKYTFHGVHFPKVNVGYMVHPEGRQVFLKFYILRMTQTKPYMFVLMIVGRFESKKLYHCSGSIHAIFSSSIWVMNMKSKFEKI